MPSLARDADRIDWTLQMKALAWKSACVQAIAMCQGEFARFGCPQLAAGAVYPGSPVGDTAVPPTHRCLETTVGQQRV